MFEWLTMFVSLIILSIDGFIIGILFGIKKIRTKLTTLLVISLFTSFVMFLALFLGHVAGEVIPYQAIKFFSGMLLIGVGIYQILKDSPVYNDAFLIKLALIINLDGLAYGIQAGMNDRGYSFALFVGLFLFIAFIGGIIQGYSLKNRPIVMYLSMLPGLVFILLGFSKMI